VRVVALADAGKEIGVGLAVAIALDATLVRLVLVPATMEVLGRWNWWLTRPLAKLLPARRLRGRAGAGLDGGGPDP
jgi:RND superfamily putative drug exporter